jgi:hypothetical protein
LKRTPITAEIQFWRCLAAGEINPLDGQRGQAGVGNDSSYEWCILVVCKSGGNNALSGGKQKYRDQRDAPDVTCVLHFRSSSPALLILPSRERWHMNWTKALLVSVKSQEDKKNARTNKNELAISAAAPLWVASGLLRRA